MRIRIPSAPKLGSVIKSATPKLRFPKAKAPKPFMPRSRSYKPSLNKNNF